MQRIYKLLSVFGGHLSNSKENILEVKNLDFCC